MSISLIVSIINSHQIFDADTGANTRSHTTSRLMTCITCSPRLMLPATTSAAALCLNPRDIVLQRCSIRPVSVGRDLALATLLSNRGAVPRTGGARRATATGILDGIETPLKGILGGFLVRQQDAPLYNMQAPATITEFAEALPSLAQES